MLSAIYFNFDQSKILLSVDGLIATFQLSSAASSYFGGSQNGVLVIGLNTYAYVPNNLLHRLYD